MNLVTKISGYITPDGYVNPRLSKLVRNGEMPDTEMRIRGVIPADAAGHVEQLLDLFGVPEEVRSTAPYSGLASILNPLDRRARPRAIRDSKAGGYKIISPVELLFEPDELMKIANGQPNHQFTDTKNIPRNLQVTGASASRREAQPLNEHGRMIRYIAGDGGRMKEYIYWVAFPEEGNFLYIASLDTNFRDHDAEVSVYLGTPERDAPDKFMRELQKRVKGLEFEVEDRRFKPRKDRYKSDEMPLPIIAGIGAIGF